jgi:hypothetical protein
MYLDAFKRLLIELRITIEHFSSRNEMGFLISKQRLKTKAKQDGFFQ